MIEIPQMDGLFREIRRLLDAGDDTRAADMARQRLTKEVKDSAVHLLWADLLEELGLVDDLITELNLAIRDDPSRQEVYVRLAEVYLDQGQPSRAARVWAELVAKEPGRPDYYREWGRALEETGDYEKAKEVYDTGLRRTGDRSFAGLMKNLYFLTEPEPPAEEPPAPDALLPKPHHLVAFLSLFGGREGVHARQWVSPTGECGYTPVEEPLTPRIVENHILGNYTAGVFPVRLDNTVNFVAIDFDMAKFAVRKTISSWRLWDAAMSKVHQAACRVVDLGAAHDFTVYLEDSGFKGRHAWIFLEEPIPAGVAKKFGDLLAQRLLPLPAEVTMEVFPRQGSVGRGGLGNLIKLPLGIHRRTGKRALFIGPDGEPLQDQLGVLERIRRVPKRAVYGYIQRQVQEPPRKRPGTPSEADELQEIGGEAFEDTGVSARPPEPLPVSRAEYDLERDPQFQTLILRCAALRQIVERARQSGALSKDEAQVLIHTVGHLERGPEAVNTLFSSAYPADPSIMLKSRLRGNPMSCPRIRSRIPESTSTVSCNCMFQPGADPYPTPLIHVRGVTGDDFGRPLGLSVDSLQLQNLVQEYLKLRKQQREMEALAAQYEKRLGRFFEEAGVDTVQTPLGVFRRRKSEDGTVTYSLDL